jgi:hypothetical protein
MSGISSQQKEGSSKKKQGLKSKRGETSYEEAPCLKKREDKIYKLLGEILSKERKKERKKGDHIFL